MSQIEAIIAKAMSASKAWPAIFEAGSAAELARAAVAALDAAGFVVVPKEPTPEMVNAADERADPDDKTAVDVIAGDYSAMIDARPK